MEVREERRGRYERFEDVSQRGRGCEESLRKEAGLKREWGESECDEAASKVEVQMAEGLSRKRLRRLQCFDGE